MKVTLKEIERRKQELKEAYTHDVAIECFDEIRDHGVIITGSIGSGKTTVAKWLNGHYIDMSEQKLVPTKIRVFDIIGNWKRWFLHSNRRLIEQDTTETNVEDNDKTLLFNLDINGFDRRSEIISAIVEAEFDKQKMDPKVKMAVELEKLPEKRFIYTIEESNVVFRTKIVNQGFWFDFVALARNIGMVGIYVTQRLADSSTKIVERIPNFIFGLTRGDNDKRKIKAMIDKEHRVVFENLSKYQFLCYIGHHKFILELSLKGVEEWRQSVIKHQMESLKK